MSLVPGRLDASNVGEVSVCVGELRIQLGALEVLAIKAPPCPPFVLSWEQLPQKLAEPFGQESLWPI